MGHRAIKDLLLREVNVEEKVDGSQFSFGLVKFEGGNTGGSPYGTVNGADYDLCVRSKGAVMVTDAPEKMFTQAVQAVKNVQDKLTPGWTYRAEYLARPKHNSLAYDRIPTNHLIIFDIQTSASEFLSYEAKAKEAQRLGFEVVPLLYSGIVKEIADFRSLLDTVSVLGGQKIEGVVVKPKDYDLWGEDKKVLMGKFVSEAFKEVHRKAWAESNPSNKDVIEQVADKYCTPARWNKAIQHLREAGTLLDDVKDIGPIMKEVPEDVLSECADEIKEELFKYAWPHIRRGLTRGLPIWYKDQLLKKSFETPDPLLLESTEKPDSVPQETADGDTFCKTP